MEILGIIGMVSDMADASANREAAKDNARRQELRREYASQMRDQRDKRTITDYNVGARGDEIDRFAAQDAEQAKEYQAGQAAGFISPRAGLGLGGIAGGMRDRNMMGVSEAATTNPLTAGSAWADALTNQHRDLMIETGQDADDMSLLMAGDRRGAGDREVLSQVAATQQGEAPRIGSMQQDAAVAKSDTGARGKKRKMDIAVKEQAIDKTYEPWIEGSADVAEGSMGEAARLGKSVADYFKPTTTRPVGTSPGGAPSGGHHRGMPMSRHVSTGSTGSGTWT
tara:strand:- start:281 stop:1126 length:846 start_codon:yes stop_codon:yes gene_type:complete